MNAITTPEELKNVCYDWRLCEDVIYDLAYEKADPKYDDYLPFDIIVREDYLEVMLQHPQKIEMITEDITYEQLSEAINKIEIIE